MSPPPPLLPLINLNLDPVQVASLLQIFLRKQIRVLLFERRSKKQRPPSPLLLRVNQYAKSHRVASNLSQFKWYNFLYIQPGAFDDNMRPSEVRLCIHFSSAGRWSFICFFYGSFWFAQYLFFVPDEWEVFDLRIYLSIILNECSGYVQIDDSMIINSPTCPRSLCPFNVCTPFALERCPSVSKPGSPRYPQSLAAGSHSLS